LDVACTRTGEHPSTTLLLYELQGKLIHFKHDGKHLEGKVISASLRKQTVKLEVDGKRKVYSCIEVTNITVAEEEPTEAAGNLTYEQVCYYKVFEEPNSAGCELSLLVETHEGTRPRAKWHNVKLNAAKTEGVEQECGDVWTIDRGWLEKAMKKKGRRTKEPGGTRMLKDDGQASDQRAFPYSLPTVPLSPKLLAHGKLCLPYAFVNALLLLKGEKPTSTPTALPQDVFDNLSEADSTFYNGYYEQMLAANTTVPKSHFRLRPAEYQMFLNHGYGRAALEWGNAPESYDQIARANLVKKGYTESGKWTRRQLVDNLLAKKAVFILEIVNGHFVCVDTTSEPPLIYETDVQYKHAVVFSEEGLAALECSEKWGLEVREVRLRFKSGKCLPPSPVYGR